MSFEGCYFSIRIVALQQFVRRMTMNLEITSSSPHRMTIIFKVMYFSLRPNFGKFSFIFFSILSVTKVQ